MKIRTMLALVLALLVLPAVARAEEHADDHSNSVVWIRYFKVHPGHGEEFAAMFTELRGAMLDQMVEDGDLLSWGLFVPFTLDGEMTWTHGVWATHRDWAQMDDFLAAMQASDADMSREDRERMQSRFMEMVDVEATRDVIDRNVVSTMAEVKQTPEGSPTYMRLSWYAIKPGHMEQAVGMYREYALPVFEKLREHRRHLRRGPAHHGNLLVIRPFAHDLDPHRRAWGDGRNRRRLQRRQ